MTAATQIRATSSLREHIYAGSSFRITRACSVGSPAATVPNASPTTPAHARPASLSSASSGIFSFIWSARANTLVVRRERGSACLDVGGSAIDPRGLTLARRPWFCFQRLRRRSARTTRTGGAKDGGPAPPALSRAGEPLTKILKPHRGRPLCGGMHPNRSDGLQADLSDSHAPPASFSWSRDATLGDVLTSREL